MTTPRRGNIGMRWLIKKNMTSFWFYFINKSSGCDFRWIWIEILVIITCLIQSTCVTELTICFDYSSDAFFFFFFNRTHSATWITVCAAYCQHCCFFSQLIRTHPRNLSLAYTMFFFKALCKPKPMHNCTNRERGFSYLLYSPFSGFSGGTYYLCQGG